MSLFVIDASLVLKWFVPEEDSASARRWLDAPHDYLAPELLFPEAGNAVWKKVRRRELTREEARRLINDLSRLAIEAVSMRGLLPDAYAIAAASGITVYDATYLALALRLDTQVVTGDERFVNSVAAHTLLAPHVRLLTSFDED